MGSIWSMLLKRCNKRNIQYYIIQSRRNWNDKRSSFEFLKGHYYSFFPTRKRYSNLLPFIRNETCGLIVLRKFLSGFKENKKVYISSHFVFLNRINSSYFLILIKEFNTCRVLFLVCKKTLYYKIMSKCEHVWRQFYNELSNIFVLVRSRPTGAT